MTRIRIASCSDRGARATNEDELRHGDGPNGPYAVLADGAGGHARGSEAAQRAADCIERVLCDPGVGFSPANLTQIVRLAHSELQHHQGSDRPEARMHTTVVVLWMDATQHHALWTNVGDSRLYRIRQGRAELLTLDDSVVQQMVRAGALTAEQSRRHPQKNHLVAALGIEGEVDPHTVVRPVELLDGDAFLLCSDGWWDSFEPEDLVRSLSHVRDADDWLRAMAATIRSRAVPRQDNFSAVAVWVGDPADVTVAMTDDTIPRGWAPR